MNEQAARSAWESVEERLRPFVAKRVRSADVDDVVQEILLRMARRLPDLRDEERFGPWMYQVARSAVADHWRAAPRHDLVEGDPPDVPVDEASWPGADSDEATRGLAACVAPFVALLPSPYREAITLTDLEGLTQKDAAEMVGVSLSGMKSRVQRGRRQLREMFDECCRITLDARSRPIDYEPRSRCACPPEAGASGSAQDARPHGQKGGTATNGTSDIGSPLP